MNGFSAEPGCRGTSGPLIAPPCVGVEVVARALPRQPLAARVVEHDDGDVRGAVRGRATARCVLDDALRPRAAGRASSVVSIARRRAATAACASAETISTKCGALNAACPRPERQLLGARLAQPLGASARRPRPCARSTVCCRARARRDVLPRVERATAAAAAPARNAACAGVSIDGVDAEVDAGWRGPRRSIWLPYAARFRYSARISRFVNRCSSRSASTISRSFARHPATRDRRRAAEAAAWRPAA